MAAGIGINNIYPPVVSPFAPNFVIGSLKGCRIYFSISAYNSIGDYVDAHITVVRQSDNINALDKTKYPSQMKVIPVSSILVDNERASADKYYITLLDEDIEGGFQTGIVYKVQIRFTNATREGIYNTPQSIDGWLSANLSAFSEWSQVCLVQGINRPELKIRNYDTEQDGYLNSNPEIKNHLNIDTLEVVGTLVTDDNDPLRQYELRLYDNYGNLVEESGVLFPSYQSYKDQLNYVFKTAVQDGEDYILEVKYMTVGLYEETVRYPILVMLTLIEQLNAYIETIEDIENGRFGIHIKSNSVAAFKGVITIRRTSSESDFKLWEDIYTTDLRLDKLDYLWYDYTIKSGVWYKYCIQKRGQSGARGIVTAMKTPIMMEFDDMFLVADNKQIRIQFNPQVPSFQRIVNDAKVDTIGAKYPYIRRNGATNYKQFQISGLISFLMDDYNLFLSQEDYYGKDNLDLYKEYNDKNRIDDYINITWERDYREKIMDFLYKHNVKLFKSATEGNILVKLMDISFTPNQQLGRRIYTFQCTAYEVADNTIANIGYYDIQTIDTTTTNLSKGTDLDDLLSKSQSVIGQWDDTVPARREFIHSNPQGGEYSVLEEYYAGLSDKNYVTNVNALTYLKLEMQDEPYLIMDNGGEPQDYDAYMNNLNNNDSKIRRSPSMVRNQNLYLGYLAKINGKTIIIPQDGIYELKGENVQITSLIFPTRATNVEIQYQASIEEVENITKVLSLTNFYTKIGQEWGGFIPGASLYQTLWDKYYSEHPTKYYTSLVSINSIRCQANPGTVIYVREEGETLANRHVIGPTEMLDFDSDEQVIADAFFLGAHFEQATDYEIARSILPEGKCNFTDIVVDSLDKIKPQDRYVYYLQSSNNETRNVAAAAVYRAVEPKMVKLTTAKGLPIYTLQEEVDDEVLHIAIVSEDNLAELEDYLINQGFVIYTTESLFFSDDQQIKVAIDPDGSDAFEFVLDNEGNRLKIKAYQVLLSQYGDKYITISLKRQLWKDIVYTISDYYIYYNEHWYVFDEDTHDAVCPVPASIDYICETLQAYYKIGGGI